MNVRQVIICLIGFLLVTALLGWDHVHADEIDQIQQQHCSRGTKVPPRNKFTTTAHSTYFSSSEINTNGTTTHYICNSDFWNRMDNVRSGLGGPIVVSSSYRSPNKNASVGGHEHSVHQYGGATDIYKVNGKKWEDMTASEQQNVKEEVQAQGLRYADNYPAHLHVQRNYYCDYP